MNTYNVNLTIIDTLLDGCCKNVEKKSILITNSSQTVNLQDSYILNVVAIKENMFTVLIQNGVQVIVRNIYTNFSTDLCLPSTCKKHLLNISGTVVPK